jgi:hypothetical protein
MRVTTLPVLSGKSSRTLLSSLFLAGALLAASSVRAALLPASGPAVASTFEKALLAQADKAPGKTGGSSDSSKALQTLRVGTSPATKPGGSQGTDASKAKAPAGAAASPGAPKPGSAAEEEPDDGLTFGQRAVGFIRSYAAWILVGLGALFVAILAWTIVGAKRKGSAQESPFAELGLGEAPPSRGGGAQAGRRFSSTKIQVAEVNTGLSRSVTTTEVETDREYALVVDKAALKMPPLPEGEEKPTSGSAGDSSRIRKLLDEKRFQAAYEDYVRQIESDNNLRFQGELESKLGEHFLQAREFEKASRVLEHHVATHPQTEIIPKTYFDLGYVHFMKRTFGKSRRFFKLFMDVEKNPTYVERAKRIVEKMGSPGKN